LEQESKNFIIGIDLGTTNSAVAYVDLREKSSKHNRIKLFKIPQLTAPSEVMQNLMLPSFCYIPGQYDIPPNAIQLPWKTDDPNFVGIFARDHGAKVPTRLVSSAKSWLCHRGADRRAKILPWGSGMEVNKISPVTATSSYLKHMRLAWNSDKGDADDLYLENQMIIITVPASFDEVARDLTLEAATLAGLHNVILLEEPLAAFYSWLISHEKNWQHDIRPGELVLVCDVGGGTTDLTLIALNETEGSPKLERIAVGDHLILGGDNIDLALARHVEKKFGKNTQLRIDRLKTLCHLCRQGKEKILNNLTDREIITMVGEGSSLIGGTLTAGIDRSELESIILEGFFPLVQPADDVSQSRRKGISEFGLPYETEPAITRHIGMFLEKHRDDVLSFFNKRPFPDIVLFNGGSLKPRIIQKRILESVRFWFSEIDENTPRILDNPAPEFAVALGAAYYGLVKSGQGVRVGSGSARSYYLGIARKDDPKTSPRYAICMIERGVEEGAQVVLPDHSFEVRANQPVSFDLYSSSFRSGDKCGDIVAVDETLTALPPMQTLIQFGQKGIQTSIPVDIRAQYTELGLLALWCQSRSTPHQWRLQFQLRESPGISSISEKEVFEISMVNHAALTLQTAFSKDANSADLDRLLKCIADSVNKPKEKWPLSFLRGLSDHLLDRVDARRFSHAHEIRWLNLTGYCLRPGFGDAADEQRMKKLWKIYKQGLEFKKNPQCLSEWWAMWRRVAGGLSSGQQRQIFQDIRPLLIPRKGEKVKLHSQPYIEIWMAVGNMERLSVRDKVEIGRTLLAELKPKKIQPQLIWALSRIGARAMLYGPLDRVVPSSEVEKWIQALMAEEWNNYKPIGAAMAQLARKTGDRYRDIDPKLVDTMVQWMLSKGVKNEIRFLESVVPIKDKEEHAIFGEALPSGIVLNTSTL
jgi:molecular chaperone DnaK (HSP70)